MPVMRQKLKSNVQYIYKERKTVTDKSLKVQTKTKLRRLHMYTLINTDLRINSEDETNKQKKNNSQKNRSQCKRIEFQWKNTATQFIGDHSS